jgi:hypothetical protein
LVHYLKQFETGTILAGQSASEEKIMNMLGRELKGVCGTFHIAGLKLH